MRTFLIFFWILLFFLGCEKQEKTLPFTWQEINGRDEIVAYGQRVRRAVYHAQIPLGWQRFDPAHSKSNEDTTQPIVSFVIDDGLALVVHTFPSNNLDERIPPIAQVQRWQGQLQKCQAVQRVGHSGFTGLYLEGMNEKGGVRAWAMQLDMQHYQTLHFLAGTVEEEEHYKQMSADYTIKVFGPVEKLEQHRNAIDLFVNSFELIQEIPSRT